MSDKDREKLEELRALRRIIREEHHAEYVNDYVHAGDFTYGIPEIKSWNEETHLYIGKFCSFAEGVKIVLGGNHRTDWVTTYPFNAFLLSYSNITGHPQSNGDIIIGNDVWIGSDAKILSGVRIGDGAVIAANALATADVAPYSIVGGIPAKHLMFRFPEDIIEKLLEMQWWDWPDEALVMAIPLLQSERFDELWQFYQGVKEAFGFGENGE